MSEASTPAEAGARAWQGAIEADARLADEFKRSAAEFFGDGSLPADELARRRLLEWFVLERENRLHGGLLVQSLPDLEQHFGPEELASWIGSVVGVFEVSSVQPGEGVWLKDLAGGGEYPLIEPAGSQLMEPGDLIAGRIFAHESAFVASPAAAFVRDAALLEALRADFERAREGRRGLVRVAQLDVERLFHPAREAREGGVEAARELLRSGGVETEDIDDLMAALSEEPFEPERLMPGADDPLGAALDQLAFETDIDLETARRALLAAWQELSERGAGKGPSVRPQAAPAASSRASDLALGSNPAEALAEFDRRRAQGIPLEQSFRDLELALGLEPGDDEDPGLVPDFPGAMAAILEEYAWETGADDAQRRQLANLSAYAVEHGVEDVVDQKAWIDFTSRWMLEQDRLEGADDAAAFAAALQHFCAWANDSQALTLWEGASAHARSLQRSLPRLAELNQRRTRSTHGPEGSIMRVVAVQDANVLLDGTVRASVDPLIMAWIRAGDLVRGEVREGRLALYAAYAGYEPETGT